MTRPQRWVNSIQESSNNVPSAICSAALWGFKLFVFLVPAHVNNASNLLAAGLNLWKLIGCWIGAIMKTAICDILWSHWLSTKGRTQAEPLFRIACWWPALKPCRPTGWKAIGTLACNATIFNHTSRWRAQVPHPSTFGLFINQGGLRNHRQLPLKPL